MAMNNTLPHLLGASSKPLAAIDIGSNSFHMVIAKCEQQQLRPIMQLGEKVQLAANMVGGELSQSAMDRGLLCLHRFKQHIDDLIDGGALRIVATNALRLAVNKQVFIDAVEQLFGCPVEVVSGKEEARLIYAGVAHTNADDQPRLVIDVGGGSTEIIMGRQFEPRVLESVQIGCVGYLRFFPDGEINHNHFQRAYDAACDELSSVASIYRDQWRNCIGCSGTLLAIEQVLINTGLSLGGVERTVLSQLQSKLLNFDTLEAVSFQGLKESRRQVFASGLAITMALFDVLNIKRMALSDAALREGVLYELIMMQQP